MLMSSDISSTPKHNDPEQAAQPRPLDLESRDLGGIKRTRVLAGNVKKNH